MGALASLSLQTANIVGQVSQQRQQANTVQAQAAYSADVSTRNALLADASAQDAVQRGALAESRLRSGTRQLIGAQRSGYAGQGVDVNSGSAADVQADSSRLGEMDALTIRTNAMREAHGYGVQASNDRTQAAMTRLAGDNQAGALRDQSVSTLLTGGSRLANMWQQNPPTFGRSPFTASSTFKNPPTRAQLNAGIAAGVKY